MQENNLIKKLSEIKDPRRDEGQRHDLVFILLIVIMATMSGYHGYRAIGDFITRNKDDLRKYFKPKQLRLPSFDTVRHVMKGIDFNGFAMVFFEWAQDYSDIEIGDWLNIDGKAIKGTFDKSDINRQHFINLILIFAEKTDTVLFAGK